MFEKFVNWRPWSRKLRAAEKRIFELEHEKAFVTEALRIKKAHVERLTHAEGIALALEKLRAQRASTEEEVLAALRLTDPNNELWRAFHRLMELQIEEEERYSHMPGLADGERHYTSGRAACLKDFRFGLIAKWKECRELPAPGQ